MGKKRVLVIGDAHGKVGEYFDLLEEFVTQYSRTDEAYSIQLGDFGFNEEYQEREKRFEKSDALDPSKHVFLGGNHDDYDHYEETVGSLGHFGEAPFVPNSFFVRGAKSLDKEARTMGRDWWPQEELNWSQSKEAIERYIKTEPEIMFSHDVPQKVASEMFPSKTNFTTNTSQLLQAMFEEHQPDKWFFGHWHTNKKFNEQQTTFHCLGELQTEEIDLI